MGSRSRSDRSSALARAEGGCSAVASGTGCAGAWKHGRLITWPAASWCGGSWHDPGCNALTKLAGDSLAKKEPRTNIGIGAADRDTSQGTQWVNRIDVAKYSSESADIRLLLLTVIG